MKFITSCSHINHTEKEDDELIADLFWKEHEHRIFIVQEFCNNCFAQFTREIMSNGTTNETTH